jgi:hypothetical protein
VRSRDVEFNYSDDWSAYLTDAKDLPEPQLIDDDNEVEDSIEEYNAPKTLAFSPYYYILRFYFH